MQHSNHQKETTALCEIISRIDNPQDAFIFLRDLFTINELKEFSQRLEIATLLSQKISYKTIEQQTGASSTTIARVSKFLNGEFGGYKKRLSHD